MGTIPDMRESAVEGTQLMLCLSDAIETFEHEYVFTSTKNND